MAHDPVTEAQTVGRDGGHRTIGNSGDVTSAPNSTTRTHVGVSGEWHLDVGNAFRHLAFDLGAGPGQPAVLMPPPLLQPRLEPFGGGRRSGGWRRHRPGHGVEIGVGSGALAQGLTLALTSR